MTEACFSITHDGPIARVKLTRAEKRNALDLPFWADFPDAIREIDRSGETRVILLEADGDFFCAGIDLSVFQSIGAEQASTNPNKGLAFLESVKQMQDTFSVLEDARVPVIAAIEGGCMGAGVDMITACDIRLCTKSAFFSVYEINVGMTADVGTFPRLLNHLPEGVVRELSYTGRKMPAAEANQYGLVNRVLPDRAALDDAALTLAREIAEKAPMAIHGCKKVITYARDHKTQEALDWIGLWNASMLQPAEVMAAMAAKQTGQPGQYTPLPKKKRLTDS